MILHINFIALVIINFFINILIDWQFDESYIKNGVSKMTGKYTVNESEVADGLYTDFSPFVFFYLNANTY